MDAARARRRLTPVGPGPDPAWFDRYIEACRFPERSDNSRVDCAVSGGADSAALLESLEAIVGA